MVGVVEYCSRLGDSIVGVEYCMVGSGGGVAHTLRQPLSMSPMERA